MKRYVLFSVLVSLLFFACKKEDEPNIIGGDSESIIVYGDHRYVKIVKEYNWGFEIGTFFFDVDDDGINDFQFNIDGHSSRGGWYWYDHSLEILNPDFSIDYSEKLDSIYYSHYYQYYDSGTANQYIVLNRYERCDFYKSYDSLKIVNSFELEYKNLGDTGLNIEYLIDNFFQLYSSGGSHNPTDIGIDSIYGAADHRLNCPKLPSEIGVYYLGIQRKIGDHRKPGWIKLERTNEGLYLTETAI